MQTGKVDEKSWFIDVSDKAFWAFYLLVTRVYFVEALKYDFCLLYILDGLYCLMVYFELEYLVVN